MPKRNFAGESREMVSFSTTLSRKTKELLETFCNKRGLRMNHYVEQAILESIEDEMDKELIDQRASEETIAWRKNG